MTISLVSFFNEITEDGLIDNSFMVKTSSVVTCKFLNTTYSIRYSSLLAEVIKKTANIILNKCIYKTFDLLSRIIVF